MEHAPTIITLLYYILPPTPITSNTNPQNLPVSFSRTEAGSDISVAERAIDRGDHVLDLLFAGQTAIAEFSLQRHIRTRRL